jgi:PEP-CTERM motif
MSCRPRISSPMRSLGLGVLLAVLGWVSTPSARAAIIVQGSFGPNGDVGFVNSPPNLSISFGADNQGQIAQMDGFINAAGQNLNNSGSGFGTSAQLTYGPPPGLTYAFSDSQPTSDQLVLSYQFVNNTGSTLSGFQFISYVNPFFGTTNPNDFGTVTGSTATNPSAGPSTYQIGDANNSTIFTNVLFGTLDNSNDTTNPPTAGTNVAMALGFTVDNLAVGQGITFEVLLSDDGSSIGSLALTDQNPDYPGDTLTLSGIAVPEPSAIILLGLGLIGVLAASVLFGPTLERRTSGRAV